MTAWPNAQTRQWPSRSPSFPPGPCRAIAAIRYVATSAWVTSAGSWSTVRAIEGTATAIIVEFSGISAAASSAPASPRAVPRSDAAGAGSAMRDRTSLQQEQPLAGERELDVVVVHAEDRVAGRREPVQRLEPVARPGTAPRPGPGRTCRSSTPPSGPSRSAMSFSPVVHSRMTPSGDSRYWSGVTWPLTTISPRPQLASISRSRAPVTGCRVKSTPATSEATISWSTTAIRGAGSRPCCSR